jgi:formamidopyrimidine-DNA glycosylase
MLALPEVEVLRRNLEKEVVGRRVKTAEVRPGSNAMKMIPRHGRRKDFGDLLEGAKIERASRMGTRLVLELDNLNALVFDLGSTGRLLKTSASEAIEPHTHVLISFTIGGQLRLIDVKRTGEVFVAPKDDLKALPGMSDFALDPLENSLTWQHFSQMLEQKDQPIKELLLDGTFICGLRDIYSDEILFAAGLRHDHPSGGLSSQDVRRLYRALTETLFEALKARGTSAPVSDFVDLYGEPGGYGLELKVFGRDGESCRRCRHEILREKIEDVWAYFCPHCQA